MFNYFFLKYAFMEAQIANYNNDFPVGAIIVVNNSIIASAHNEAEINKDATAHAEIIAIQKACKILNTRKLDCADMYLTLEPCAMCAGAIVNAKIKNLYFICENNKSGCCISKYNILLHNGLNWVTNFEQKYYNYNKYKNMIKNFFKNKRKKKGLI